jgi:hypothetical protein
MLLESLTDLAQNSLDDLRVEEGKSLDGDFIAEELVLADCFLPRVFINSQERAHLALFDVKLHGVDDIGHQGGPLLSDEHMKVVDNQDSAGVGGDVGNELVEDIVDVLPLMPLGDELKELQLTN